MQMHKVIGSLWRQRRMGTRNEPCGAPQKKHVSSRKTKGTQGIYKRYKTIKKFCKVVRVGGSEL